RIHFSINYSNLDFESRKAIWNVFVGKIAIKKQISEEEIEILAKEEMNGRQQRNPSALTIYESSLMLQETGIKQGS
ncbi:1897_t:CDS:2, partial [Acaulospora colombiana]